MTLNFSGGQIVTTNINQGREWRNGTTRAVMLNLPSPAPRVSDITGVTITTNFRSGLSGDNWNVDKVALVVSFPAGSTTTGPTPPVVHDWLIPPSASSLPLIPLPLIRFTGDIHDLTLPVSVPPDDLGRPVTDLKLIISTGNDDLRGGSNPGDNCNVTVQLTSGQSFSA